MGFFNLKVTERRSASTANTSNTTRPSSACPSVPAISIRDWWITKSNPASAAPTGLPESVVGSKKGGTEALLNTGFGLLFRYGDLTTPYQFRQFPTCEWR